MWSVDDLLTIAKRKAQLPSSNAKLSDTELRSIADEELHTYFVPLIRSTREDYWLTSSDQTMTVGTATYRIPTRTISGSLVEVWRISGGVVYKLARINLEDRWQYTGTTGETGVPVYYTIEGDLITLFPTPSAADTLRVRYERRPAQLVAVSACGPVTAVGASTLTVTGNTIAASDTVDVAQANPNFDTLIASASVTSTGSGPQTVTFSGVSLTSVSVGDYVCQEGTTCVVPLPDAWHYALAYKVAETALREIGDDAGSNMLKADLQERLNSLVAALRPRANTDPQLAYNVESPMRQGWRRGWY